MILGCSLNTSLFQFSKYFGILLLCKTLDNVLQYLSELGTYQNLGRLSLCPQEAYTLVKQTNVQTAETMLRASTVRPWGARRLERSVHVQGKGVRVEGAYEFSHLETTAYCGL